MFDLIFVILLAIFLFRGYKKGLVIAICSLLAIVLGVVGAMKLSSEVANLLFKNDDGSIARWAPMVSYLLLFFIIVWLVRLLAAFLQKSIKMMMLGWVNQCAGALLYGFMFCFIWSTFLWLGDRMGSFSQQTKSGSRSWSLVAPVAPSMFVAIGNILPFVRSAFDDLNRFYDGVGNTMNTNVDTD